MSAAEPRRVGVVVVAGGKSARFGRDKAVEPLEGLTFVERVVSVARELADEIVVVAGVDQALPELGAEVRLVRDAEPFPGPLAALARGVRALDAEVDVVVALAVDLPWLRADVLREIARACPAAGAAVPVVDDRLQPLAAAYGRGTFAVLLECADGGVRSMFGFLDRLDVTPLELATLGSTASLTDVDTVSELERLTRNRGV